MRFNLLVVGLLFVSLAYSQPKNVEFEFTNRTDMELSYVYFYSKWDNSKGRNYIAGKTLKPGEKISVSIRVEKKSRCKRTIHIEDNQKNKVVFPGFNPCKDGNIGLMNFNGLPMMTEEN